jgi:hypothetical protein
MKNLIISLSLAVFCLLSATASGQADEPCAASALAVGTSCSFSTFTNIGASTTTGPPAPLCASFMNADVWFTTTVPASGHLIFDSNTGAITDGGMAIYTGTCGSLTLVECDDDDSANGAMAMIDNAALTPGATVWIRVWAWGGNNNGTFDICVVDGNPSVGNGPVNDEPCTATALTVGATCGFSTFTNIGASTTTGPPAPGCASFVNADVWFTTTVPASGHLIFDSNTGVITDGGMAIYTGTCESLTLVECDDDDSANGAMAMIDNATLTPGATIWIRVWEFGGYNNGTFDICVVDGNPTEVVPANDEPCTATALTVGATCGFSTFTTAGAGNSSLTTTTALPTCANFNGADVWFSVTVPASGHLIFDSNTGVIMDGGMEIYTGTCGSLTLVECDDDDSANGVMAMIDNATLTPGETIFVRFWEYGADNNGTFDICVQDGDGLAGGPCYGGGSDCAQVQPICTDNTYCYTAGFGSTASAGNDYGCLETQPNPSWYYFEIFSAGTLIFDLAATSDIDFAIWGPYASAAAANADCGALPAPVDCSYSTSPTEQVNLAGVAVGEIYVLVVTNYASLAAQYMTLTEVGGNSATTNCNIVNGTVVVPANDEPCTATALTVGATCGFSTFTTAGAGNSSLTTTTALPTCSSFNGADVWFTTTVPASGHLIFDTNIGGVTDAGMAVYTGTCGSLSLVECDDDDSANGDMAMIDNATLTPGETVWIRVWEYEGDNNGTFDICVVDGSCTGSQTAGCTVSTACNYDSAASIDDGNCEYSSCGGCAYATATNYDSTATIDDGTCVFPDITSDNQAVYDGAYADGEASVDITSDNQDAYDDGIASVDITSDNQAVYDGAYDDGVASVDITSDNQDAYDAGVVEGLNSVCLGDFSGDGFVSVSDLGGFLSAFGTQCE